MSQPRHIAPGKTYVIERRAVRRHHLFAPSPAMTQIFQFVLAWCAGHFGILIHAAILMSTHEHVVLTDVFGVLPDFLAMHHRLVALATKVFRRWEGAVWDHEPPSVIELTTPEAVIDQIGHAIVNPVAAGLVADPAHWPGVVTLVEHLAGGALAAERPAFFFDPRNSKWGDRASVTLTMPPMLEESFTPDSFRDAVRANVDKRIAEAHAEQRASGRSFAGPERCKRVSPYRRAKSVEPIRKLNPRFAAGPGQHEARRAAILALREFRAAYRAALERWRSGHRDVVFPEGTWLMVRLHRARVVPSLARAA
jgi:putative transposase